MAEKYNVSTAQLLLRYSSQKGYTPIVKAMSPRNLYANIEAENLVISEKDMAVLDSWDEGIEGSLCMSFHIHSHLSAERHSSVADESDWDVRAHNVAVSLRSSCAEGLYVITVLIFNQILTPLREATMRQADFVMLKLFSLGLNGCNCILKHKSVLAQ